MQYDVSQWREGSQTNAQCKAWTGSLFKSTSYQNSLRFRVRSEMLFCSHVTKWTLRLASTIQHKPYLEIFGSACQKFTEFYAIRRFSVQKMDCFETVESSPHPEDPYFFNYILILSPISTLVFQAVTSPKITFPNLYMHFLSIPCMLKVPPNNTRHTVQIMELIIMQFSPYSNYFPTVRLKCSSQRYAFKYP